MSSSSLHLQLRFVPSTPLMLTLDSSLLRTTVARLRRSDPIPIVFVKSSFEGGTTICRESLLLLFTRLGEIQLFPQGKRGVISLRFNLPTTMLMGSAPSLRCLNLDKVFLSPLSQLLSSTTGLVDLSLRIDTIICPSASLLAYLQGMPCLCRLRLQAQR
jgi:hypothetical protein